MMRLPLLTTREEKTQNRYRRFTQSKEHELILRFIHENFGIPYSEIKPAIISHDYGSAIFFSLNGDMKFQFIIGHASKPVFGLDLKQLLGNYRLFSGMINALENLNTVIEFWNMQQLSFEEKVVVLSLFASQIGSNSALTENIREFLNTLSSCMPPEIAECYFQNMFLSTTRYKEDPENYKKTVLDNIEKVKALRAQHSTLEVVHDSNLRESKREAPPVSATALTPAAETKAATVPLASSAAAAVTATSAATPSLVEQPAETKRAPLPWGASFWERFPKTWEEISISSRRGLSQFHCLPQSTIHDQMAKIDEAEDMLAEYDSEPEEIDEAGVKKLILNWLINAAIENYYVPTLKRLKKRPDIPVERRDEINAALRNMGEPTHSIRKSRHR